MATEAQLLDALAELIQVSHHAVNRYRQRVCPQLCFGDARRELRRRILREGVLRDQPPSWLTDTPGSHRADYWLLVGADVALPLRGDDPRGDFRRLVAVTAMCRGFQTPAHPPAAALAWDERRRRAALLERYLIISPRAVRRYRQHREPKVSAHADLVELILAGTLTSAPPPWAPHRFAQALGFVICDEGQMALALKQSRQRPDRLLVDGIIWQDWQPTERQRGLKAA